MLGEFALIERFFRNGVTRPDVVEGIGDDAAVLQAPAQMELVVTVDTLIKGVHFPAHAEPETIGFKCLAVNLSDLAAMGAEPAWFTLALTLPESDEEWLSRFCKGMFDLAQHYGVALIGGDTTRGALSVTVTAMGFVPRSQAMRREGARPGDAVYVTGTLGDAGLGLATINNTKRLPGRHKDYCLSRLHRPQPRVEAGIILRDFASAAIDISDGLVADINHVLSASGVGADIQLASIPLSEAFREAFGDRTGWEIALAFGDDYELLFTVPEHKIPLLEKKTSFLDHGITRIGRIESSHELRLSFADGTQYDPGQAGYRHFK